MASKRVPYYHAWECDTPYAGKIEPGMWIIWETSYGLGYSMGRVLSVWPARIRIDASALSDWTHECRREAVRAAFACQRPAAAITEALHALAQTRPFLVFNDPRVPGRYQRLLEEARAGGFLKQPLPPA